MGFIIGKMAVNFKDGGIKENSTGQEFTRQVKKTIFNMEFGKWERD